MADGVDRQDTGSGSGSGLGARAGRGLRIALGVSLALNLLVVGVVAGAFLREGGPRDRMVRDLDLGPLTDAFRAEDRMAMRREFIRRMPALRDMRDAMQQDFGALLAVLRREPFDRAAAQGVLENQRQRMQERVDLGQELILDRLAAMSPEARAGFADQLERRLRRGGPGDGPAAQGQD